MFYLSSPTGHQCAVRAQLVSVWNAYRRGYRARSRTARGERAIEGRVNNIQPTHGTRQRKAGNASQNSSQNRILKVFGGDFASSIVL